MKVGQNTQKIQNVRGTVGEFSQNKGKEVEEDEPQKNEKNEGNVKGKMIVESEAKEGFGVYLDCALYSNPILEEHGEIFTSFIQQMATEEKMPSLTNPKKKIKGKNKKKNKKEKGRSSPL